MVQYSNCIICIFMNINENLSNGRKTKKIKGRTYKITFISIVNVFETPAYTLQVVVLD